MTPPADTISIALCTYNGEEYLSEQLQSFLGQTRLPDELVVCDDGSTDRTLAILEEFKVQVPFKVRIHLNGTNLGYVKNFEQALLLCEGSIVFPADQDDVWKSEKIETILNVFRDNLTAGIVVTNAELVDRHLVPLNRNLWESFGFHHSQLDFMNQNVLQILLFGQNFVSGNTIAVRSDLIRFLRTYPIPSNSAHDHWLGLIASLTSAVVVFDYEGIQYRQHQSQLLGAGTSETPFRIALAPADKRFIRIARDAVAYADALRSLVRILDTAETCRAKADIDAIGDEKARKLLAKKVLDLSDKSVHYEIRYHLPVSRLGRLPILLSECKSRRYARYSSGLKSVIYDFLRAKTRDAGR